jgi:hypothetical protein
MTNSALSFVGQIQTEYREACKAESGALQHAIECGKYLALAKENVKAEKGKWLPWLETNCPEIPQTTASLYMRLAENEAEIGKAKSIREAMGLLSKRTRTKTEGTEGTEEEGEDEGESEDEDADADSSSGERSGKRRAQPKGGFEEDLKALAPDEVCKMLIEVWEDTQLQDLMRLMGNYLQGKRPPTPLTVATAQPRPN